VTQKVIKRTHLSVDFVVDYCQ